MRLHCMTFAALIASLVLSSVSAQEPLAQQLDLALKVSVDRSIKEKDESVQQSYQKVAEQMTALRIGVPEARLAYFQNHPLMPRHFGGWDGWIEDITPQRDGGLVVLLTVQPRFPGSYSSLCLYERYLIKGGKVKYLGNALHPSDKQPLAIVS